MKKGLLIISCIAATTLLVGCRGGRGRGSTSASGVLPTSGIVPGTSNSGNTGSKPTGQSSNTSITPGQKGKFTVLVYMCGSDLESGGSYGIEYGGLATSDIQEMVTVTGQPSDVNIVIETGGASQWVSTFNISSSKLGRYHIRSNALVKDEEITYASMGLASTLKDFLVWGMTKYPADKTALIFWNHGNGMQGCCFDEKKNDDNLLNSEIQTALSGAFNELGRTDKLEWIGYDCCLMQIQDIAETNSTYANFMVASQESESGTGWDYDTWVDDLYAGKTTEQVLTAIVDGFIEDNGGANLESYQYQGETYAADQTLSWLDLSKANQYMVAWENMATQLKSKITSSNKSSWNTLVDSAKHFAGDDYAQVGIFDAKDFVNKLAANSTFNPGSTYTNAVLSAHSSLVKYNVAQKGAGNAYGLSMFYDIEDSAYRSECYTNSDTHFTNWKYIVDTYYGESSGGGGWWY